MNLYKASNQWATRPADERFWTLDDMYAACNKYHGEAGTSTVLYRELRAEATATIDGKPVEVRIIGKSGTPAMLTHWAFGQLSARAEAPANYLRTLPAPLAADCINTGLAKREDTEKALMLFHRNGGLLCRSLTGTGYVRIWNDDIVQRLRALADRGWRVPPARPFPDCDPALIRFATADDVLRAGRHGLSVQVGDPIAPAGLYASDHDMFTFMVNEDREIDAGNGERLFRGFFSWNSEVGDKSFGVCTFLYDSVCGNHIVWGAKGVRELRVRHVGEANDRAFRGLTAELKKYADESASDTEAKIKAAKSFYLGTDKNAILDRIFGLRNIGLTRKAIGEGYDLAEQYRDVHGDPNTAWGLVSGLTRLSQQTAFADDRVALDRAAGKVLDLAF